MIYDVLVDACISRKVVSELRNNDYNVFYINEVRSDMPDKEVMNIGYTLEVPIATHNIRHFLEYIDLIKLPARKSVKKTVNTIVEYLEGK